MRNTFAGWFGNSGATTPRVQATSQSAHGNSDRTTRSQSSGTLPNVENGNDSGNGAYSSRNPTDHRLPSVPKRERALRDQIRREQQRYRQLQFNEENLRRTIEQLQRGKDDLDLKYRKLKNEGMLCKEAAADHSKDMSALQTYYRIVVEHIRPYARIQKLDYKEKSLDSTSAVLTKMGKDALLAHQNMQEIPDLRARVQTFQEHLLARVDRVQVVSDDHLAQEFRSLLSAVRTLSRGVRAPEAMNILGMTDYLELCRGVSQHHWAVPSQKKYLFEAYIWSTLITFIFQSPFSIFGNQVGSLNEVWKQIFGAQHHYDWPLPSEQSEKWKVTTTERLVETAGRGFITSGTAEDSLTGLKGSIANQRTIACAILGGNLYLASQGQQIRRTVNKAFALAMQMSLQRCRLQVTFPTVGTRFDINNMAALPGDDGEDMLEGKVAFIANPGLTKWGDANGNNIDCRYDIVQSLVMVEQARPHAIGNQGHVPHHHENTQSSDNDTWGHLPGELTQVQVKIEKAEPQDHVKFEPWN